MIEDEVRFIRKFPDKCCAAVTREGELEPCDKTAVAVCAVGAYDDGEDDPHWWPACAYHTRVGRMVPLTELITATTRFGDPVMKTHARVQIIDDALLGVLPGAACYQDSKGHWLVEIGAFQFYINGIAHVIDDALTEAGQ